MHSFRTESFNVVVYAPHNQRLIGIFQVDLLRSHASLIAGCFERFRITIAGRTFPVFYDMPMIIQHWQQSVATLQPFDVQARLRKTQGE
ncbi:hypothetical protein NRB15_07755 [Pseudomonas alliivorans]|nr:hypothetical protein [Pseudomonas alliivorans]MCQ9470232.1 hypothetical protein [Pseudomonas alliivorans]